MRRATKSYNRYLDRLVRIDDRAMMRRLIMDNRRQRKMIRAYRDAIEFKDILNKVMSALLGFASKIKDKAGQAVLAACKKALDAVKKGVPGAAKFFLEQVKKLVSYLPDALKGAGAKLIGLGKLLASKVAELLLKKKAGAVARGPAALTAGGNYENIYG